MAEDVSSNNGGRVQFVGRLASYKYFNMDAAIENALQFFERLNPSVDPEVFFQGHTMQQWVFYVFPFPKRLSRLCFHGIHSSSSSFYFSNFFFRFPKRALKPFEADHKMPSLRFVIAEDEAADLRW